MDRTVIQEDYKGSICGPSLPSIGSTVPMRRQLHDNGCGACLVLVTGLYGGTAEEVFCSFAAYPSKAWQPDELPPRSLAWLEKRIKTWDKAWPSARWRIRLAWPWQSEEWVREQPAKWVVTKVGPGIT